MTGRCNWLGGARLTERRAIGWERLRKTEKDWERLGSAPIRLRDYETTGRRDDETTRRRETPEKPRRSQAFSGVLRRSQLCAAAWCQKGAECYTRQKCRRWVVLERTSH